MEQKKESNPNYLPYPPYPPHPQQSMDNEIDLRELFSALWKGKWIIIVSVFIFGTGALLYSLTLPDVYKSEALLAPADNANGGGLSKMASQLGGLAAIAGINIGNNESSQMELSLQVLKSRKFVSSFINKHELLVPLMAAKGWNLPEDELIFDESIYDVKFGEWLREPKGLRGSKPSDQEAYDFFVDAVLNITQDKASGLYNLSVKYYSPYIAKQWVDWLIEDINHVMRERTIKEATKKTLIIHNLKKTAVADMQNTFYKLIEEQTKSLMLAEVQEEFVFKVVDPSVVPEVKYEPKRYLICFFRLIVWGAFGLDSCDC
ncbi:LOW QUALITY PROTEIN: lipopolysaccharide biosynthesis [Vibrio sp. JCM 19053]|nr:LOW QUALITY PROTEIN: lipopolysaccharide biosynthesis [Vibrio sp. JCM 19053]